MLNTAAWPRMLPAVGAALALGAFLAAGGGAPDALVLGAVLLAAMAGAWPLPARWGAAVLAVAAAWATLDAAGDAHAVERSRVLAAAALACGLGRAVDAALAHLPRTGFSEGAVGTVVAAAGLSIAVAILTGRPPRPEAVVLAGVLLAVAATIARAGLRGSARASIGAWLGAGWGLAAIAGVLAGSADLPRLGTTGPGTPLVGAAVAVLAGRALHELGEAHVRRAIRYGAATALLAALNLVLVLAEPDLVATPPPTLLGGRDVQQEAAWWMPGYVSVSVLATVGLMLFTASAAFARFGWGAGWLCGLLLAIGGSLGLTTWMLGSSVPLVDGLRLSSIGSLSMLSLGFGAMQLASSALHSQRQRAVWLPALLAVAVAGASVVAWRAAERQEAALREERAALALERAVRGIREAVVERTEALGRAANALRLADPARRAEVFRVEAETYAGDHPGSASVFLAGPERTVLLAHRIERAGSTDVGDPAAWDEQRRAAYAEAQARGRAVMLGPLALSAVRGTGFVLIVPLQVDGAQHFLVASGRYGPLLEPVAAELPPGLSLAVRSRDAPVFQWRAGLSAPATAARTATVEVLRVPWRVEMTDTVGAGGLTSLPRMILLAGLLLAGLSAAALRFAALAREREVAATAAAGAQLAAQRALAASRAEAARVLDTMAEAVLSLDRDLRLSFANARAAAQFAASRDDLVGCSLDRVLPRGIGAFDIAALEALCRAALDDGRQREAAGYAPDIATWVAGRLQPGGDGITLVLQDVSEARRAQVFEREQREILREIAEGASLDRVLSAICTLYDDLHPGAISSAVLFDPVRGCLSGAIAPRLPADYVAAIDGLPIGPVVASCGTSMHRRERVVVTDVAADPLWADYRDLATRFGLGACWSQPFLSRDGEPLGTFSVYHREPREPGAREIAALETLASLCAVATERDRALRQLAESEQRFRSLFDLQPDAVFAFDLEGRIVAVNEAVVALSGYPREAILGHPYDAMIEPSDRARVRGFFAGAVGGAAQRYTTVGVRADGAQRVVDVTNLPIVVDGRIVGIYGVTRDVTEQRAAEARLKERDRFFALSPSVFAISDGRGHYTEVNDAFPRLLGVTREEVFSRRVLDFVHPEDVANTLAVTRALGCGETLAGFVHRVVAADGSVRWLEWTALRTDDGKIHATARDVTVERMSQQSEALMRRVIEGSPAVLWRWRSGGRRVVDFVTDNVAAWGYRKEDFEDERLAYADIVHPDDRALLDSAEPAPEGGGFIYRIRRGDGGIAWVDERTATVRDGAGGIGYRQGLTLDVTAVMQAREQEDRLLRAIGEGPAVLWRFNPWRQPTAQMVTGNVRRWGWEPSDFTSGRLAFVDLVHPDDRDALVVRDLARIEAGEDQFSREYRLRTADGRWVWLSEHLQAVRDPDGSLAFCLALSVDVTEQRLAREQERQLRQVIELSPAVLWRFNLADPVPTKLVSSNVRALGYAPEDFTSGRVLFGDLIHPEDRERIDAATEEAIADGAREMRYEFRWRTADGRWLWLDERVTVLRGPRGEALDCVSLTLDVTEQREALAKVHERDQFYALSLEVFAVIGRDARFRQVNEALHRVLGYGAGEIVGRHVLDFLHPDDVAAARGQIDLLAAGGRAVMVELRCRHAEGGWRWLEWNAAGGAGGLYYCAARDITHAKAVSAELRRALRDLELRNAELQDFAFVASHDLQEPLRKVQAFSDRVLQRYAGQLDAQGADYLRRMDAAASRMQSLIDDLLAYSRVSTRGGSFREVDLAHVLDEVASDLEARLESTGGEIVRSTLPVLEADPTQMRQLLQNLLGNALKFAVPGRRPRVEVHAEPVELASIGQRRPGWRLIVSDNGIGFEDAHAERIFAPFQRLHGRSEYEGTGMGLAIVRKIVERHGGAVAAHGSPGQGARFSVDLPARQSGTGAAPGGHDPRTRAATTADGT